MCSLSLSLSLSVSSSCALPPFGHWPPSLTAAGSQAGWPSASDPRPPVPAPTAADDAAHALFPSSPLPASFLRRPGPLSLSLPCFFFDSGGFFAQAATGSGREAVWAPRRRDRLGSCDPLSRSLCRPHASCGQSELSCFHFAFDHCSGAILKIEAESVRKLNFNSMARSTDDESFQ
jgi:hypothetical protein